MQFTQSMSYPGTVDEVVAMYLTPAYLERRFGQFVVEGSATVSVEGERVSFAGTVRPELIPAAAARFVKSDLRIAFTEEWATNEAGATSRTSVTVDGAPVSVEATSTLASADAGCNAMSSDARLAARLGDDFEQFVGVSGDYDQDNDRFTHVDVELVQDMSALSEEEIEDLKRRADAAIKRNCTIEHSVVDQALPASHTWTNERIN